MEPILNELSIEPVEGVNADERMLALVATLKSLSLLGAARPLRATQKATERLIAPDVQLYAWMIPRGAYIEEKRFLSSRLTKKAPFVEELYERAEHEHRRQFDVRYEHLIASGLGAALLLRAPAVSLSGVPAFTRTSVPISVTMLDENGDLETENRVVLNVWDGASVGLVREQITQLVLAEVASGESAWSRREELFSNLEWSAEGERILRKLDRSTPQFHDVVATLVTLSKRLADWSGGKFHPGMRHSEESETTKKNRELSRLRECTLSTGERLPLSWHLKLYSGWRIYYQHSQTAEGAHDVKGSGRAVIGYIGPHLPTSSSR